MAWALVDDNFPHHPKVMRAEDAAKGAGWLFICALCYCRKYHTGGLIPRAAIPSLGAGVNPRKQVDALVVVGLWDVHESGFAIHDYEGFYADEVDKANRDARASGAVEAFKRRSEAAKEAWKGRKVQDCVDPYQCGNPVEIGCNADARVGSGMASSDLLLRKKKSEADFATFWQGYPKKDGKQAALKAWLKLAPDDEAQRAIAADIQRRATSPQWLKDSGQYIPHASTYLNGKRWEDGYEEPKTVSKATVSVIRGGMDYAAGE